MNKKDLLEQLADFPDDAKILIWHDDMGLVETDCLAQNISEDENNGAAVIYLNWNF